MKILGIIFTISIFFVFPIVAMAGGGNQGIVRVSGMRTNGISMSWESIPYDGSGHSYGNNCYSNTGGPCLTHWDPGAGDGYYSFGEWKYSAADDNWFFDNGPLSCNAQFVITPSDPNITSCQVTNSGAVVPGNVPNNNTSSGSVYVFDCTAVAPSNTTSCSGSQVTGTISWGGQTDSGFYVDISYDPNFSVFMNKYVGWVNSTDLNGFGPYQGNPFSIDSGTTYYVRVYNGHGHSNVSQFNQYCQPAQQTCVQESCPNSCGYGGGIARNTDCSYRSCDPVPAPAAGSCPNYCGFGGSQVPDGACGVTNCPAVSVPAAQACPSYCGYSGGDWVPNGACGYSYCPGVTPPAAQSCPAYCGYPGGTVPNGACGVTNCPANLPAAAQSCPAYCGYPGGTVPNGACGVTNCPANLPAAAQACPNWAGYPGGDVVPNGACGNTTCPANPSVSCSGTPNPATFGGGSSANISWTAVSSGGTPTSYTWGGCSGSNNTCTSSYSTPQTATVTVTANYGGSIGPRSATCSVPVTFADTAPTLTIGSASNTGASGTAQDLDKTSCPVVISSSINGVANTNTTATSNSWSLGAFSKPFSLIPYTFSATAKGVDYACTPNGNNTTKTATYSVSFPTPVVTLTTTPACNGSNPVVNLSWDYGPANGYISSASVSRTDLAIPIYSPAVLQTFADSGVGRNTAYTYSVSATNTGATATRTDTKTVTTLWCDTSAPAVSFQIGNGNQAACFDNSGSAQFDWTLHQPITVSASDAESGIASVSLSLIKSGGGTKTYDANSTPKLAPTATPGVWSVLIPTSDITPGSSYTLTATAVNGAGLSGSSSSTSAFSIKNSCTQAFIQSKDGSVHTQDKINIPGGPTPAP